MNPTLSVVLGFLGLFVTIITSAVGVAAWITTRLAKIETEVKHAFLRITALEEAAPRVTPARRRKSRQSGA